MTLSILSRTPPWPGSRTPASFTPTHRLNRDSIRSPIWAPVAAKSPSAMPSPHPISGPLTLCNRARIQTTPIVASTSPPRAPSMVFFGLILGINFRRPKRAPKKRPPVSAPITASIGIASDHKPKILSG